MMNFINLQETEGGRFCQNILVRRNFANKNVVLFGLLGSVAHCKGLIYR
jgi:hypothetical protein